jgi:integrase
MASAGGDHERPRRERPDGEDGRYAGSREQPAEAAADAVRLRDPAGDAEGQPGQGGRSVKAKGDGFHEWTEAEIAKFEKKHPLGTKARLALEIFVCTAQRRSDAATMGEDPDKPGYVKVRQLKTDAPAVDPHSPRPEGRRCRLPVRQATFLVSERGTPYTKESLGNWFKKQCVEAGLPHCSAHGLRKAAARRMAELGLSNQLIKSITGHTTDSEVALHEERGPGAESRQGDGARWRGLAHLIWRTFPKTPENAR